MQIGVGLGLTRAGRPTTPAVLWTPANLAVSPRIWGRLDTGAYDGANILTGLSNAGSEGGAFTVVGSTAKGTALNGLTTANFSDATKYLTKPVAAWNSGKVFAWVLFKSNDRTLDGGLLDAGLGVSPSGSIALFLTAPTDLGWIGDGYAGGARFDRLAGWIPDNNHHLTMGQIGTAADLRLDGATQVLDTTTLTAVPNYGALTWSFMTAWAGGLLGQVLEFGVCDYYPTTAEKQQIEGYALWRAGLQANLPAGHPYVSAAPTF